MKILMIISYFVAISLILAPFAFAADNTTESASSQTTTSSTQINPKPTPTRTITTKTSMSTKTVTTTKINRKPAQSTQIFYFNQKITGESVYQKVRNVGEKHDDSEMNDVVSYKAEIVCHNAGGTVNDYCEIRKQSTE